MIRTTNKQHPAQARLGTLLYRDRCDGDHREDEPRGDETHDVEERRQQSHVDTRVSGVTRTEPASDHAPQQVRTFRAG
jgi:hypothetical protein